MAEPKKQPEVTNQFLYSDFRGMIHADHEEALKNSNFQTHYYSAASISRVVTPEGSTQHGATQNLRGRMKHSESVKEIFPVPEFNTYLSQPTKKKPRRRLTKPYASSKQFKSVAKEDTLSILKKNNGMHFASSGNFPAVAINDYQESVKTSSLVGTRQPSRMQSHQSHRQRSLLSEQERREIEEVQESMKAIRDFDRKLLSVKNRVGYPSINLKGDLKNIR